MKLKNIIFIYYLDTTLHNHKIYQIKNITKANKFIQMFAINESILGTNIIDINYMDDKGVLIIPVNKKCTVFI